MAFGGYLEVGTTLCGEVVINLDYDRVGHIVFSAEQARQLAHLLLTKAGEAEAFSGSIIDVESSCVG
jgi:hypothetical protein